MSDTRQEAARDAGILARVRRLGLLALVLALAAAGCGSSSSRLSKDDYEQHLQQVVPPLARSLLKSQLALEGIRARGPAQSELVSLRRSVDGARARLAPLDPPAGEQATHTQLVRGLRRLDRDLAALTPLIARNKLGFLQRRAAQFGSWPSVLAVRGAFRRLIDDGYDIGVS